MRGADQVNVDQVDASVPVDTTLPDAFTTPTDTSQQTTRPSTTVAPNSSASTLPAVGWNPVNVNSCTQVNNDILISNAVNNGAPYILSTACRNGGDGGLKFYTMKCLSNTQYRVDWRPCTSQETAAVTNPSQTVATCSETDNGLDYNVFGRTTGNDEVTGVYGTYGDSCGAYVGDSNQSAGAYIAEKHCSSGNGKVYVHTQWYNCPNGCSAGACLAQKPTVAPVATCSETDNGLDYNVFGRTTGNDEVTGVYGTYPDSCGAYVGDSGKDSGAYIAEKHCSSGNGKVYVHTQWYNCENGCSAGACLAQKPVVVPVVTTPAPYTTCSETDNGIDYNVFGKTTGNDENTGIYGTYPDSCGAYVGDSGKDTGAYIAEKHCSSGNGKVYVHTQWYNCANGCSAGACLAQKVATNDSCYSNPLSVALSSASPLSQNLYMGQTNTELVRVKLTNSNCADLRVNEVDTAFSSQNSNPNLLVNNFKLIAADGNIQLGNTLANPGLNNAFYTSFIIPANSSKEISVYSDISLNTTPGWFQTGINALATTNLVTGANSTVNSRIYGNQMTVIAPRN